MSCFHVIHRFMGVIVLSSYVSCLHVVFTCHANMSCLYVVLKVLLICRAYMSCLYVVLICSAYVSIDMCFVL